MPITDDEKRKAYEKKRNQNPERKLARRQSQLKTNYGISMQDYNEMFEKQKGRCAICNTHCTELKRALAVDHCHITGKVRGLLCDNCNHALGKFKDDVEIIKSAIEYLKFTNS